MCSNIKPIGPLEGLLGGRFLTAFAATFFTGAAKGVLIGWLVQFNDGSKVASTMIIYTMLILSLILSLFNTCGLNRTSFKMLLHHPELVIIQIGLNKYHYMCNNLSLIISTIL